MLKRNLRSYRDKLVILDGFGFKSKYHLSFGSTVIDEYDNFKFSGSKDDQALAKEMIDLDYDTIWLKEQNGEL